MGKRVVTTVVTLLLAVASVGVAADPDPSLQGYWKFDGDYLDSSGNGRAGTPAGDATFAPGLSGFDQALTLDGSGDYVTINSYMGILGTNPFSISLWVNSTNLGDRTMVNWGSSTNGQRVDFRLYQGRLRVEHGNGNLMGNTVMADGEWHHAALVVGPNSRIQSPDVKIYLDGVDNSAATSDPDRFNITAVTPVTIGRRGTNTDRAFLGLLDEVRIYDRVLTAAEIGVLSARPKAYNPGPPDGTEASASVFAFTWMPRQISLWHDVYLGASPDLGPQDLVKSRWPATTYIPDSALLTPGTTYYWRVDEIDPDGTVHPGDVWSVLYPPQEAWRPLPGDAAPYMDPNLTLTWKPGLNAIFHDVYFGTDAAAVAEGTGETLKSSNQLELAFQTGPLEMATTYFWRVDEVDAAGTKVKGHVWSFKTLSEISVVNPNLAAWWTFDEGAYRRAVDWSGHGHHADFVGTPQWVPGYDGTALEFDGLTDQRLEAAGFDGVTGKQDRTMTVWIKTAGTGAIVAWGENVSTQKWILRLETAASAGVVGAPRVEINGGYAIGSRDMRDNEWHHVASVLESAGAPTTSDMRFYVDGELDPISGVQILDVNTAPGRDVMIGYDHQDRPWPGVIDDLRIYDKALTQAEIQGVMVRFDPLRAWRPHPAHHSIADIRTAAPLTWESGDNAVKHDVYLGADAAAAAAADSSDATGIYRGRISTTSFTPSPALQWDQQYFWRVDEVGADGGVVTGGVWDFTIADYLPIDNFETYTNDSPNRIFQTWVDGLGFSADEYFPNEGVGNGSNGMVGHDIWSADSPYYGGLLVETDNPHSDWQAMPLYYDNTYSPYYSEAVRTWTQTQDWTVHDVNTLLVYFRGEPADYLQTASGSILMSAAGWDLWTDSALTRFDEGRFVYKRLTGDGSIIVRVDSITNTNAWAKGGVMIRESLDWDSPHASLFVTPGQGVWFQRRLSIGAAGTSTTEAGVVAPHWVKLTRTGDLFTAQHSDDSMTWGDVVHATNPTSDTVFLSGTVYIGLALTSHAAGVTCTAEFSGLQTTGNVTGSWEMAEIGVDHPGNSPDSLYLAISDSSKTVTVPHPDPLAVVSVYGTYAPWPVDLAQLQSAGLNLRAIKKMSIGVGDKSAALPNGAGRIFIDDIRLTRGVPVEPNTVEVTP